MALNTAKIKIEEFHSVDIDEYEKRYISFESRNILFRQYLNSRDFPHNNFETDVETEQFYKNRLSDSFLAHKFGIDVVSEDGLSSKPVFHREVKNRIIDPFYDKKQSEKRSNQLDKATHELLNNNSDLLPVFITVTQPNIDIPEDIKTLRDKLHNCFGRDRTTKEIDVKHNLNHAISRLFNHPYLFPDLFPKMSVTDLKKSRFNYFRTDEVTVKRAENGYPLSMHPHVHVLLFLPRKVVLAILKIQKNTAKQNLHLIKSNKPAKRKSKYDYFWIKAIQNLTENYDIEEVQVKVVRNSKVRNDDFQSNPNNPEVNINFLTGELPTFDELFETNTIKEVSSYITKNEKNPEYDKLDTLPNRDILKEQLFAMKSVHTTAAGGELKTFLRDVKSDEFFNTKVFGENKIEPKYTKTRTVISRKALKNSNFSFRTVEDIDGFSSDSRNIATKIQSDSSFINADFGDNNVYFYNYLQTKKELANRSSELFKSVTFESMNLHKYSSFELAFGQLVDYIDLHKNQYDRGSKPIVVDEDLFNNVFSYISSLSTLRPKYINSATSDFIEINKNNRIFVLDVLHKIEFLENHEYFDRFTRYYNKDYNLFVKQNLNRLSKLVYKKIR